VASAPASRSLLELGHACVGFFSDSKRPTARAVKCWRSRSTGIDWKPSEVNKEARALGRILLLVTLLASSVANGESFGRFVGNVIAEWLDDGRQMKLVADFAYIDPAESEWRAPAGSVVDGASIPKFAWSVIGGPFEGKYRNASVIHDVACRERKRPWEAVHETFYNGMRASGVDSLRARTMYAAVYHFGPRWDLEVQMKSVPQAKVATEVGRVRTRVDPRSKVEVEVKEKPRSTWEMLTMQSAKADITVRVGAVAKDLAEGDFVGLETLIREREASAAGPLSLGEIRSYHPASR